MSSGRGLRPEGEARPELVAALESYLRVEQVPEARQARRSLPAPLDDQEAVAAARAAFQRIAEDYHATSQTRAPLNLGIYLAGYSPTEAPAAGPEWSRPVIATRPKGIGVIQNSQDTNLDRL